MTDLQADLTPEQRAGLDAARELVAAGVPVFVAPADPSVRLGFALPAGWHRAPLDPQAVDRWRPGDALCAVMGHTLDLADVDPRSGGNETFAALQAAGLLPTVHAVAATPAGGRHYFVTALGVGSRDDVRPGLDVKGGRPDGTGRGFAFLAPTVRVSKTTGEPATYEWIAAPDAAAIATERAGDDSGAALAELVRVALSSGAGSPARPAASPPDPFDEFEGVARAFTRAQASAYCMPELDRYRAFSDADRGWNQALNALAMRFGHFVPHFVTRAAVENLLYEASLHNGAVSWQGDRNIRATIASGVDAGMRQPYALAEDGPSPPGAASEAVNADTPSADPADVLMGELLTAETIKEIPNPRPLINGVLDLATTSWLIGKSGSYKSFVALDMAGCVATGKPWHGHAVTQRPVVIVVAEGATGTKLRVGAWEALYGPMGPHLYFLPRPVQASNATAWDALTEVCVRVDAGLVVIDTQARVTVGMDENDNTAMGIYVERADQIKRATGACVLTVHHIGRNGTDARGASALDGAQDTELRVRRDGDRRVTIVMDKQKDTDDTDEIELELARVEGGVDEDTLRDLSSLAVVDAGTLPPSRPNRDWVDNLPANQAEVLGIVADHFTEHGGTKAEIKRDLGERRTLAERPAMAGSSYSKAWDKLVSDGNLVRVRGSQRYVLRPEPPAD